MALETSLISFITFLVMIDQNEHSAVDFNDTESMRNYYFQYDEKVMPITHQRLDPINDLQSGNSNDIYIIVMIIDLDLDCNLSEIECQNSLAALQTHLFSRMKNYDSITWDYLNFQLKMRQAWKLKRKKLHKLFLESEVKFWISLLNVNKEKENEE